MGGGETSILEKTALETLTGCFENSHSIRLSIPLKKNCLSMFAFAVCFVIMLEFPPFFPQLWCKLFLTFLFAISCNYNRNCFSNCSLKRIRGYLKKKQPKEGCILKGAVITSCSISCHIADEKTVDSHSKDQQHSAKQVNICQHPPPQPNSSYACSVMLAAYFDTKITWTNFDLQLSKKIWCI